MLGIYTQEKRDINEALRHCCMKQSSTNSGWTWGEFMCISDISKGRGLCTAKPVLS